MSAIIYSYFKYPIKGYYGKLDEQEYHILLKYGVKKATNDYLLFFPKPKDYIKKMS